MTAHFPCNLAFRFPNRQTFLDFSVDLTTFADIPQIAGVLMAEAGNQARCAAVGIDAANQPQLGSEPDFDSG